MIRLRRSKERGFADHGWLKSHHTFSFANYYDPEHMGFRSLRVINEDFIAPGMGFGTHGHEEMEIISYVVAGALAHKDSMGNGSSILPGDVQYMSAGTGVQHSEFNHSTQETTHLLQIWILPNLKGQKPRYDQKQYSADQKRNQLCLVVSPDGAQGSIAIRQDARIYASLLQSEKQVSLPLASGRHAWVQLISGEITVNGEGLRAGDAAAINDEKTLQIQSRQAAEFLLFDLA